MAHSFSIGSTPVRAVERLVVKLTNSGRLYRLYAKQSTKTNSPATFSLKDDTGQQVGEWAAVSVRSVMAELKNKGYKVKTIEDVLYRKQLSSVEELIEHVKLFSKSMRLAGIPRSSRNHYTVIASTMLVPNDLTHSSLTESLNNKRKDFVDILQSLDQFKTMSIKVGAAVSIINTQLQGDYVELWGFTNPKTITKITRDPDDYSIKQFEFDNNPDDVWPRIENVEYNNHLLVHSAFFKNKMSADHAITTLLLSKPEGLNISNRIKEDKGFTMNTNEQMVREDHFSPDEVATIKGCDDQRVRDFYREYVRAEAMGDTARADMMATMIKDRCDLLGITEAPSPVEAPCEACGPTYESWEAKMRKAGARHFDEDAAQSMVKAYKVIEGTDTLLGEYDKALCDEVFETKKELYTLYTTEGDATDKDLWTENVLAEGATSIKTIGDTTVAYINESRIGHFTSVKKERKIKSFTQMLSESATKEPLYEPLKFPTAESSATNVVDILRLSGMRVDEAWANEPDEKVADAETQLNTMSGGINRKKKQVNPNNPGDNPLAMKKPAKAGVVNADEEEIAESLSREFQSFDPLSENTTLDAEPEIVEEASDNSPGSKGFMAGYKGASAERNPYDPGTAEYKEWQNAWEDGREEMRDKSARPYRRTTESDLSKYADKIVSESVEYEGDIGDDVIITGHVNFKGATGIIADFGQDRRFVIVNLYNHGKHSFHASDVSINEYAGSEEEEDEMDRRGFGESAEKQYTGRETKAGVWRVFEKGNSTAVAGPFDTAAEANKWIKNKSTVTEAEEAADDEDEEEWYDKDGKVSKNGAYDAGGHYHSDRDVRESAEEKWWKVRWFCELNDKETHKDTELRAGTAAEAVEKAKKSAGKGNNYDFKAEKMDPPNLDEGKKTVTESVNDLRKLSGLL